MFPLLTDTSRRLDIFVQSPQGVCGANEVRAVRFRSLRDKEVQAARKGCGAVLGLSRGLFLVGALPPHPRQRVGDPLETRFAAA